MYYKKDDYIYWVLHERWLDLMGIVRKVSASTVYYTKDGYMYCMIHKRSLHLSFVKAKKITSTEWHESSLYLLGTCIKTTPTGYNKNNDYICRLLHENRLYLLSTWRKMGITRMIITSAGYLMKTVYISWVHEERLHLQGKTRMMITCAGYLMKDDYIYRVFTARTMYLLYEVKTYTVLHGSG